MSRYKTIDAHVVGEAVRLLVEGAPAVKGRTMMDKLSWLRKHGEALRRALMLEPRGHAGMHGALFTEPVLPKAHAGLLFMNAGGFPMVSGEAVMAATIIALEQQIIHVDSDELYIDTPAGLLTARPAQLNVAAPSQTRGISLTGLAGFVQSGALPVRFGNRTILVDVAFGGEFFAIVDSEAAGIPIDADHAPELIRAAGRLKDAVEVTLRATHPSLSAMHGVIFTAPARQGADLRSATVLDGGVLRRSPGVTGTIALMAVLDAMGIVGEADTFIHEGLMGTSFVGRILKRQTVDEMAIVLPVIETMVTITGYHEFVVEENSQSYKI
jgi:proline racemase